MIIVNIYKTLWGVGQPPASDRLDASLCVQVPWGRVTGWAWDPKSSDFHKAADLRGPGKGEVVPGAWS